MKSPKISKLVNGNTPGSGGFREGAGRKPDWLKAKCGDIVDKSKLVEFLGNVASGIIEAEIKERLRATEMLLDRGFGKPASVIDMKDAEGNTLKGIAAVVIVPLDDKGAAGELKG